MLPGFFFLSLSVFLPTFYNFAASCVCIWNCWCSFELHLGWHLEPWSHYEKRLWTAVQVFFRQAPGQKKKNSKHVVRFWSSERTSTAPADKRFREENVSFSPVSLSNKRRRSHHTDGNEIYRYNNINMTHVLSGVPFNFQSVQRIEVFSGNTRCVVQIKLKLKLQRYPCAQQNDVESMSNFWGR